MSPSTHGEVTMGPPDPGWSIIEQAVAAIHSVFPGQDDACQTLAGFVPALEHLGQRDGTQGRRLAACASKFAFFARAFEGYFDLLGLCMTVRPDWQDGLVRVLGSLFQIGRNYILFLEKTADLLEAVARVLPPYRQLYDAGQRWRPQGQGADERAAALMAYIYADMAQFCIDMQRLFVRGAEQGIALRHLRLSSPTIFWRPLDSRFAQLESQLALHNAWLNGEVSGYEQDPAAASRRRSYYLERMQQHPDNSMGCEDTAHKMARRMRRVDKVKAWLSNTCSYRDIYENRLQRHPNTCAWFLSTAEYCKWRNAPFDHALANDVEELERTWQDRVLFVQAKPGFGKSFLSGAVIDDLSAEADDLNIDDEYEAPTIAYFHFNAAHSYCVHPIDAFRAIAYQLVHTHRHDRSTLDAISLLMRKTPPDARASTDDVFAVLSLLLHQHPTFLVIDGIDECSDVELLLNSLPEICRRSDTRTILFSRPDIEIPRQYQRWASDSPYIFRPDDFSNAHDIELYLSDNLNRMADAGFFGISMDRSLLDRVPERANGIFLWAGLLLKYMQSPGMSPDQRHAVLENIAMLDGLDSLYQNIFSMLESRPDGEKAIITTVFRWISFSINRMCMSGFQKAVMINPGHRTKDIGPLSTFLESIPLLTCGLVEVTQCNVVFTHRSVPVYLKSPASQASSFSLADESTIHAHLAARCLSFLAYDVPKRPLSRVRAPMRPALTPHGTSSGNSMRTSKSGDSGYKSLSSGSGSDGLVSPTSTSTSLVPPPAPPPDFDADLPFLRYASLCWPIHLTRALSHTIAAQPSSAQPPPTPYLPALSAFLTDRAAVTAWVEASWRYQLPPNLSRLVPLLSSLKGCTPPASVEGREIRWVVQGLRELSAGLNELREGFGTALRGDPGLVWGWRGLGAVGAGGRGERRTLGMGNGMESVG